MATGEVFPIINCRDLSGTLGWYERVMSGILAYRFPDEGDLEYATLRIGAGQVAFGNGTVPAIYGETPLPSTGHSVDLCLSTFPTSILS